ncbi:acyltransferase 3 [Bisporella sp. PMI_857]|nr:acyltransferase 3 [Bisporella sp. PMI_857]
MSFRHDGSLRLQQFLLPRYYAHNYSRFPKKDAKLSATAYLDGLRGVFACLVFVENFSRPWQKGLYHAYGERDNHVWLQLPIIRAVHSGPSVAVFFLISGYVISYKPLLLIRNRSYENLGNILTTSVFRRGPRLFLPALVSSLYIAITTQLGLLRIPSKDMTGHKPQGLSVFSSFGDQMEEYARFARDELTNVWNWQQRKTTYDSSLWTIPVQFRASIAIFVILLGTSRLQSSVRKYFLVLLFVYWMLHGQWEVSTFLGGMFLAERDIEQIASLSLGHHDGIYEKRRGGVTYLRKCFLLFCLLVALHLGSFPQVSAEKAPGFMWLAQLSENDNNWKAYSALLLIYTLGRSPSLQKLFLTSFAQYLGKISFSIYLVHGPMLQTFGYALVPYAWKYTGKSTAAQYQSGFALAFLVMAPLVIYVADLFRRVVERPCLCLVWWFEKHYFVRVT